MPEQKKNEATPPATAAVMAELGAALAGTGLQALKGRMASPGGLSVAEAAALARAGAIIQALGIRLDRPAPRAHNVGQQTVLTNAVFAAIITSLCGGSTVESAAAAAGVAVQTVHEWVARGAGTSRRARTPLYASFAAAVDRARNEAVDIALGGLLTAGAYGVGGQPPDWRALEAWLRLMYPARYGRRVEIQISDAMRAAAQVAREHGLGESYASDILARANEIAEAAGSGGL